MVLFIDTNVAINYLTNRTDENSAASTKLMAMCGQRKVEGYIASHSIPVIWYVLRKYPDQDRRIMLRSLCTVLSVVGANQEDIMNALDREDFVDFEDCLQDECAQEIDADYIVTCNIRDFGSSIIPAITPTELLKLIEKE